VILALAILLLAAVGPWLVLAGYLEFFGVPTRAEVIGRQESVSIQGDHSRHDFVVSYRYRPADAAELVTASQRVSPALYDRLATGSQVGVRYSPWAPLRAFGSAGVSLEDASWTSRLPWGSNDTLRLLEIEMSAVVAVLGYVAYRRKSRPLILLAVTAAASVGAGVLLFGFLIFPLLLLLWWRRQGQGFGWVLLVSIAGSAAILAWRVPWPPPAPLGEGVRATAVVRQLHDVDRVWGNRRMSGQPIRQPFQIVDLELTPPGSTETVHAIDRVDRGSVADLAPGLIVEVEYPSGQPRGARMDAGRRDYAWNLFLYVLALSYGTGAVLLLIGLPLMRALGRFSRSFVSRAEQLESQLAALSADDPRRRIFEEQLRTLKDAERRGKPRPPGA